MGAGGEWEDVAEAPDAETEEPYEEEPTEAAREEAYDEEEPPRPAREPARAAGPPDRSVFAMLSGLGFFIVALLLVLGIWNLAASVPAGAPAFVGVIVLGLVLAGVIPFLWMLGDLRIRSRRIRKSHARFIAGPLIGVLAIVLSALFTLSNGNWLLAALAIVVVAVSQASVALFLYSMLWEG